MPDPFKPTDLHPSDNSTCGLRTPGAPSVVTTEGTLWPNLHDEKTGSQGLGSGEDGIDNGKITPIPRKTKLSSSDHRRHGGWTLAIDAATTAITSSKTVHRMYDLVSDTHAVA